MKPSVAGVLGLWVCLLLPGGARMFAQEFHTTVLSEPRPGRAEAMRLAAEGMSAYHEEKMVSAEQLLEAALLLDPTLAVVWTNLAAVRIHLCEPSNARVAAFIARLLDPQEAVAARNLSIAARLECPEQDPDPLDQAEATIVSRPNAPESWLGAAHQRRQRGETILAAFYTEFALERGADPSCSQPVAMELAQMGLLRQGLALLEAQGVDPQGQTVLAKRLAALAAPSGEIARKVSQGLGMVRKEEIEAIRLLAEVLLARGASPAEADQTLARLLGVSSHRRIRGEWGSLSAGREWFLSEVSLEDGAPLMVLRRFPGDLQLAIFAWEGGFDGERSTQLVEKRLRARLPERETQWESCAAVDNSGVCQQAGFGLDLGAEGRTRALVRLVSPAVDGPGLALVSLIGDTGCGESGRRLSRERLGTLLASLRPGTPAQPAGNAGETGRWVLPVPAAWQASREHSESKDPWRSYSLEGGVRIDLPAGLCAVPVRDHNRALVPWPDARLWMRGRFEDREGVRVILGDDSTAGWVASRTDDGLGVATALADPSILIPHVDPGAELIGVADLAPALAKAGMEGGGWLRISRGRVSRGTGSCSAER